MCGSGTNGALVCTASFTALKSWIIRQSVLFAFCTGKIGVLQGESGHGRIMPLFSDCSMTGFIPTAASGFKGYCLIRGCQDDFGVI